MKERLAGVAVLMAMLACAEVEAQTQIEVNIEGSAGLPFTAHWQWRSPSGDRRSGTWQDRVPQTYRMPPGQFSVQVVQHAPGGRLAVTLLSRGNRSSSTSQGAGALLLLSVQ